MAPLPPTRNRSTAARILAIVLLALFVGMIYLLKEHGILQPEHVFAFLEANPVAAPALFLLLFVILSMSLVPTLPLNLGAGFLWGPVWGSILTILGTTIGASCSFLISRHVAKDYCNRKFRNPVWFWLKREIENKSWKAVAFVRMNPAFSTGVLNYFFGITPLPFRTYLWSTAVFLTPPSILIAAAGHLTGRGVLYGEASDIFRDVAIAAMAATGMLIISVAARSWFHHTGRANL